MYVLVSTPSGNLLGEYPTLEQAQAARDQYVAIDPRNADALEIVFDDGRGDEPGASQLPRAS